MTLDAHVTGIWCGQIGGGGVGVILGGVVGGEAYDLMGINLYPS